MACRAAKTAARKTNPPHHAEKHRGKAPYRCFLASFALCSPCPRAGNSPEGRGGQQAPETAVLTVPVRAVQIAKTDHAEKTTIRTSLTPVTPQKLSLCERIMSDGKAACSGEILYASGPGAGSWGFIGLPSACRSTAYYRLLVLFRLRRLSQKGLLLAGTAPCPGHRAAGFDHSC